MKPKQITMEEAVRALYAAYLDQPRDDDGLRHIVDGLSQELTGRELIDV